MLHNSEVSTNWDGSSVHILVEWCAERLVKREPVFAHIRCWCGETEVAALEAEVERLRGLIEEAVSTLKWHGNPHLLRRLDRRLRGVPEHEPKCAKRQRTDP